MMAAMASAHDAIAVEGTAHAPDPEAARGGGQRRVQIRAFGTDQPTNYSAAGGIGYRDAAASAPGRHWPWMNRSVSG
jgi:hypothetical protein